MVKIIEIHHVLDNKDDFQSRIIEAENFEHYKDELLKNGYSRIPYVSIPRRCKIENLNSGDRWLECEFNRPSDNVRIKHIAWELQLDKTNYGNIEFENGSKIDVLETVTS